MKTTIAGLLSLIALAAFGNAAAAADLANGQNLAKRWCAACHVVTSDQKSGTTQAAPFSAMAKETGCDAGKLALYLLLPHPKMPDMNLSRAEAADLAAYIASQGK